MTTTFLGAETKLLDVNNEPVASVEDAPVDDYDAEKALAGTVAEEAIAIVSSTQASSPKLFDSEPMNIDRRGHSGTRTSRRSRKSTSDGSQSV